uniref:ETS domain-containing protein n=1 Tax=Mesocestoides corti TaxID=53468 RepID=A0A5K3FM62_MESCO
MEDPLLSRQCIRNPLLGVEHHFTELLQKRRAVRNSPVLWQFLLKCLNNPQCNPAVIEWVCEEEGVFRLTNARHLAKLWGEQKHKPN